MKNITDSVKITGFVGKVQQIQELRNGKKVLRFLVGTKENPERDTDVSAGKRQWQKAVAWGPLAEYISENVSAGQQIVLEGTVENRTYVDKKGTQKSTSEMSVNKAFLIKK